VLGTASAAATGEELAALVARQLLVGTAKLEQMQASVMAGEIPIPAP
jgi:hypothetical protein